MTTRPSDQMTTLIHLSDLHFGPVLVPHLCEIVLKDIATLNPDAVVISGDFTLRARHREYEAAREFLHRINKPTLTIPGNHDQPLFNPIERLTRPCARYCQYVHSLSANNANSANLSLRGAVLSERSESKDATKQPPTRELEIPFAYAQGKASQTPLAMTIREDSRDSRMTDSTLAAGDLFIVGLNDNRPILPGGFWSRAQRAWLEQQLASAPRGAVKVVVTHHQLLWEGKWRPAGFWYPSRALELLARHGVALVLNGHTHTSSIAQTREGIVVARAGTATSSRMRHGSGNSYNLITIDEKQISVFVRCYDAQADAFVAGRAVAFRRSFRHAT